MQESKTWKFELYEFYNKWYQESKNLPHTESKRAAVENGAEIVQWRELIRDNRFPLCKRFFPVFSVDSVWQRLLFLSASHAPAKQVNNKLTRPKRKLNRSQQPQQNVEILQIFHKKNSKQNSAFSQIVKQKSHNSFITRK